MMRVLPQDFYLRRPDIVARELLGKLLVRVYKGIRLSGFIVETEAYFGEEDPASRARKGGDLAMTMRGEVGIALVYGVHRQWLLNVVAHEPGNAGAVLIRAIEPFEGINMMKKLRAVNDIRNLTNGPGKLTRALAIDKRFHKRPLFLEYESLRIEQGRIVKPEEIGVSFRVNVTKDMPIPLRFYIKNSKFLSR